MVVVADTCGGVDLRLAVQVAEATMDDCFIIESSYVVVGGAFPTPSCRWVLFWPVA
jgi:hypothetical protein